MNTVIFLFATLSVGLAGAATVAIRANRLTAKSCSALIQEMRYVDLAQICAVARDLGSEVGDECVSVALHIERLGGAEGLLRLHHNAGVMMDVARYLMLVQPEAYDLAQQIRHDAFQVRRSAKILYWRQRTGFGLQRQCKPVRAFARRYLSTSINLMTLCSKLVDEVLPLLQAVAHVQARMNHVLVLPT